MSAHDPVSELLALAKAHPHAQNPRRDAASFRAFEVRLARRSTLRHRALRFGLVLMPAALALALLGWPPRPSEAPLRYHVTRETVGSPALGEEVPRLRFSDGSSVALGGESEAHVRSTTPRGAHVLLHRGSLEAAIVPRQGGDWWFEAGPYRVHVTGTAFALHWSPERQLFQLTMHSGSVEVRGPMTDKGVSLRAGQRLVGSLRDERILVESAAQATARVAPEEGHGGAHPMQPEPEAPEPPLSGEARRRKAERSEHGFAELVTQGRFSEVLRAAGRVGVERVLKSASAPELSALADAARYEGDPALARRVLLALRARFGRSSSGRSAAFFLARVSHGEEAVRWYEVYLQEQPEGPFAAAALGGLMAAHAERGARAASQEAAQAYLRRDPTGPYAPAARRILGADGKSAE